MVGWLFFIMSKKMHGIGASNGIAIANIFKLKELKYKILNKKNLESEKEIELLNIAIQKTKNDIEKLQKITLKKLGSEKAAIFEVHKEILCDPVMIGEIKNIIKNNNSAVYAINNVAKKFISMIIDINEPYFKERADDIKDVTDRLIKYILNIPLFDLTIINKEVIIISKNLTPSQMAQLNPKFVKGFVCDIGGRTSHAAIIARSLEIPAVFGLKNITKQVNNNDIIIINGLTGEVILNPNNKEVKDWTIKKEFFLKSQQELLKFKNKSTISKDGYNKFILEGNIEKPEDIKNVLNNGGQGIGLFRSEFLYINNDHFPTENEQFESYKYVLEGMRGLPVIIRTLDIGGDKKLSYFKFPKEINPFLGHRAIRFCFKKIDVFRTQLRALLRASIYGKLRIMFPMIATIDEFKTAKKITLEEKLNLINKGYEIANNIEIGMMVEIPAAAILIDKFTKYSDFFSIGTNDLIQYTMAADRMNQFVEYLYQPYNPSVLRLIKIIIDAAHKEKKYVGICGEMASEELAIPILMGMELDYFSMSSKNILNIRRIISKLEFSMMKKLTIDALNCETSEEVISLIEKKVKLF